MKVFRMFGMFIMATFLCVNLTSCFGDDDEEEDDGGNGNGGGIVATGLEGTWGLTNDQGWEIYDDERGEWNESYDPRNPSEDDTKIIISKIGGNKYNIDWYKFSENGVDGESAWLSDDLWYVSVDGSVMTLYGYDGSHTKTTFSLNNNQLVIIFNENDFYHKYTFVRM